MSVTTYESGKLFSIFFFFEKSGILIIIAARVSFLTQISQY